MPNRRTIVGSEPSSTATANKIPNTDGRPSAVQTANVSAETTTAIRIPTMYGGFPQAGGWKRLASAAARAGRPGRRGRRAATSAPASCPCAKNAVAPPQTDRATHPQQRTSDTDALERHHPPQPPCASSVRRELRTWLTPLSPFAPETGVPYDFFYPERA